MSNNGNLEERGGISDGQGHVHSERRKSRIPRNQASSFWPKGGMCKPAQPERGTTPIPVPGGRVACASAMDTPCFRAGDECEPQRGNASLALGLAGGDVRGTDVAKRNETLILGSA